jgi:hypothetical protein
VPCPRVRTEQGFKDDTGSVSAGSTASRVGPLQLLVGEDVPAAVCRLSALEGLGQAGAESDYTFAPALCKKSLALARVHSVRGRVPEKG